MNNLKAIMMLNGLQTGEIPKIMARVMVTILIRMNFNLVQENHFKLLDKLTNKLAINRLLI